MGTHAVSAAARAGTLEALIVARDAADGALGRLPSVARDAPVVRCGTRAVLGAALGRDPVAVVGVTDPGLAARVVDLAGVGEADGEEEDRVNGTTRRKAR